MAIDYHRLKDWPFGEIEHAYTERDTILYALALGLGADPLDERRLRFVYERDLLALPTMAVVLGYPGFWMKDPETGIDWTRVLHGEQSMVLHRPLPAAATVTARSRVTRIVDKGPGKGALVTIERTVTDRGTGEPLATVEQLNFCRGDGGYSASGQPSDEPAPPPPRVPDAGPDAVCRLDTRPETALLYRLCGDPNPLHADPETARAAGFPRPILHGLATYGLAGHALLQSCCDYRPQRLRSMRARFTAPVFPGECVQVELWRRSGAVHYRARVAERDTVVLDRGYAEIV